VTNGTHRSECHGWRETDYCPPEPSTEPEDGLWEWRQVSPLLGPIPRRLERHRTLCSPRQPTDVTFSLPSTRFRTYGDTYPPSIRITRGCLSGFFQLKNRGWYGLEPRN